MVNQSNPSWLIRALRALLPNAAWDVIKILALAGGAGMLTLAYRVLAYIRGLPEDRIIDITIFAFSLLLLLSAYLISRRRKQRSANQGKTLDKSEAAATPKRKVLIATPVDNEAVGLHHAVRGYVFPPDSSLQVLVYAGDQRWYPQPQVDVNGYLWSVECRFGNEQSKDGSPYKLMAVHGERLTEPKYKTLPDGLIESNVVKVHRGSFDTIPRTETKIVIVTPLRNEGVGYCHIVRGSVTPPGTPLQVLVGASDGPWSLQGQVEVKDSVWSVECTFGNEEDKPGGSYNLIAVLGEELKEKVYRDLPAYLPDGAITSDLVSVQRRPPDQTQLCPNRKLHEIAENDREQIGEIFRLIWVQSITHLGEVPFIEFIFGVYNIGLVSVSIDDSIKGQIGFFRDRKQDRLVLSRTPMMKTNRAKGCPFRSTSQFSIRQEVSPEEAAFIERSPKGAEFFLGDLRIMMRADGSSSDIRFETAFTIEKNGILWTGHPASALGGVDEEIQAGIIKVQSTFKQQPDGGNPVALSEQHNAHPGGQAFVAGEKPVEVALTPGVVKALRDGKIIVVE